MPAAKNVATLAKARSDRRRVEYRDQSQPRKTFQVLAAGRVRNRQASATPAKQPKVERWQAEETQTVSNRCKMPDTEYAQLTALKKHLIVLGIGMRKSELLRAGLEAAGEYGRPVS